MNLYLVRHGKTLMNEKGLIQGSSNTPLNETGIKEANMAKEELKNVKFDMCFSSPLKRTMETAKIITDNKCDIIIDNRLIERDVGSLEGKRYDEYAKGNYWDQRLNNSENGVEPVNDLLKRVNEFLNYLKTLDYENVLIVSHAATIRAMHYNILGYDDNTSLLDFYVENAKVYKYKIGGKHD